MAAIKKEIELIPDKKTFDDVLELYRIRKDEENELKKINDLDNKRIKKYMVDNNMSEYSTETLSVKLDERKSESYNEFLLMKYLKENGFNDCIKTKEYIDTELLDKYIYNNIIDKSLLSNMKDIEITQVLTVKAIKQKK